MFLCSIAFMKMKSIWWTILWKITHPSISGNFCDNWSCRNNGLKKISMNNILDIFFRDSFKTIIIISINENMVLGIIMFLLHLLENMRKCFLHGSSICLSDTKTINFNGMSHPPCAIALPLSLEPLNIFIDSFTFLWWKFLWISESYQWYEAKIKRYAECSCYNRTCPSPSSSFINTDEETMVHEREITEIDLVVHQLGYSIRKLFHSKYSLLNMLSLYNPTALRKGQVHAHSNMRGKSGHHSRRRKANGFGPAPYQKCRVRKVPQRQYYPGCILVKGEKSFGVVILITWKFMRKKKRLQMSPKRGWQTLSDARRMVSVGMMP